MIARQLHSIQAGNGTSEDMRKVAIGLSGSGYNRGDSLVNKKWWNG